MTDMQAATNAEVAAVAGTSVEGVREPRLPLGVILYVVLASGPKHFGSA
jgi:hypothetical protein